MADFYVITRAGSKRSNRRLAIVGGLSSRKEAAAEAYRAVALYQGVKHGIEEKTKKSKGQPCVQGYVSADGCFSAWIEKGPKKVKHVLRRAVSRGELSLRRIKGY